MQNKNFNRIVVAIVIFSMMAVYGSVPSVNAASLSSAKDTLSTSAPSASATHTFTFTTGQAVGETGTIEVFFATSTFTGILVGNVTCPNAASTTESVVVDGTGTLVKCDVDAGQTIATGTKTLAITSVTSPAGTGSKTITIRTTSNGSTVLEDADVMVAIIDTVSMSATVPATLTFTVGAVNAGVAINGVNTTATSTATSTPFGNLVVDTPASVGQTLAVVTNADDGYAVTVVMDQDLSNGAGATIDSFIEGSATSTPTTWAPTTPVLDSLNTYGHMGISTSDDIAGFAANKFIGLSTTTPKTIMSHNGPADGTTAQKGLASVVYSVEVSSLQEAGDYSASLTYVCTPTY